MRISCILAAAALLCAAVSSQAEEHGGRALLVSVPTVPKVGAAAHSVMRASLTFVVSVCLADVEYSIACQERSSLEATRRLEQVYLDAYTTRRASASLQIWFPLAEEQGEQLRFLREVEDRAIASTARKLQQDEGFAGGATPNSSDAPDELPDRGQRRAEELQKWREDASLEARKGTNWSHDWASRTHFYKPNPTLDALARLNRDQSQN